MSNENELSPAEDGVYPTSDKAVVVASSNKPVLMPSMEDLSNLTLPERVALFKRKSEAEAADLIPDALIGKDITVISVTPYQREIVDKETGEIFTANYVTFVTDTGAAFRSAASGALSFAMDMARFIGLDANSGNLNNPVVMQIVAQRATQGFIHKFIFKDIKG